MEKSKEELFERVREEILHCYDWSDTGSLFAAGKRDALRRVVNFSEGLEDLLPKFDEIDKRDAV